MVVVLVQPGRGGWWEHSVSLAPEGADQWHRLGYPADQRHLLNTGVGSRFKDIQHTVWLNPHHEEILHGPVGVVVAGSESSHHLLPLIAHTHDL